MNEDLQQFEQEKIQRYREKLLNLAASEERIRKLIAEGETRLGIKPLQPSVVIEPSPSKTPNRSNPWIWTTLILGLVELVELYFLL